MKTTQGKRYYINNNNNNVMGRVTKNEKGRGERGKRSSNLSPRKMYLVYVRKKKKEEKNKKLKVRCPFRSPPLKYSTTTRNRKKTLYVL